MKSILLLFLFLTTTSSAGLAQRAMCRATLENNVSNGNIGIAAGINQGILYLFFAPYLAVAALAYLWYRTSKPHEHKELSKRSLFR